MSSPNSPHTVESGCFFAGRINDSGYPYAVIGRDAPFGQRIVAGSIKSKAEAEVLAASFDMLDALQAAASSAGFQYMTAETRAKIDAALARATGEN